MYSNSGMHAILMNPATELSPPPSAQARAGRMNAEGISVFYGALEVDTCLAELRPSIGGHLVIGTFATTEKVRLLDFRRLDRAYWGRTQLSYFQSDFQAQMERRKFLRNLHRLISLPVLPGQENEYLITQTLAEYLVHVRQNRFDGMLFQSTQRAGGTNIALFPKSNPYNAVGQPLPGDRYSVGFVDQSPKLHLAEAIKYDTKELDYSVNDEDIYVHSFEDHDDDDD